MKRLLMILMMVVLPFQLSWAAAAAYCQHENSPVSSHFGHHVHKHAINAADAKTDKSPSKLTSDDDCTVCHLGGAGIASMAFLSLAIEATNTDQEFTVNHLQPPPRPKRPERPQWASAAL